MEINLYYYEEFEPSEKEIKELLHNYLKPLTKSSLPDNYDIDQVINQNYLDILLKGRVLKFLVERDLLYDELGNQPDGFECLDFSQRMEITISGIVKAAKSIGIDLSFELEEEGLLLCNYKPNFYRGCGCRYTDNISKWMESSCGDAPKPCSPKCFWDYTRGAKSEKYILIGFKLNGMKVEYYDCSPMKLS